jgi:hypothetical protein
MLKWIENRLSLGCKPGATKTVVIDDYEYKFNLLQCPDSFLELSRKYEGTKETWEGALSNEMTGKPGRDAFFAMLKLITVKCRSKSCLDYYYVRLIETFEMYQRLVTDMEKSQCDALKSFAEHCLYEEYKQHKIRQQLVSEHVYEEKRKKLRA